MLLLIALRNLKQRIRRTILLGSAMVLVTALLVLLTGLVSGIQVSMFDTFTSLFTGHVNVEGFYKVTRGKSFALVTDARRMETVIRSAVPEVEAVVARDRGWAKAVSEAANLQLAVTGVDIETDLPLRRVLHATAGRIEDLNTPDSIVLFAQQAEKLEVKVGDTVILSASVLNGAYNTADVRVVAIAEDVGIMSSVVAFVPHQTLRKLHHLGADTTGALLVYLKDVTQAPAVKQRLRDALDGAGLRVMEDDPRVYFTKFEKVNGQDWTGQKLDVTTWEDVMSQFGWMIGVLRALTSGLVGVLLVIIVVGIMNALWISIRERTREIGTLRAIGMPRSKVLQMVLAEAFLLSLAASATGALLGAVLCGFTNLAALPVPAGMRSLLMRETLLLNVDAAALVIPVVAITLCTTLVAIVPCLHAARMKPIEATQHIG